jgi:hypothetical protein
MRLLQYFSTCMLVVFVSRLENVQATISSVCSVVDGSAANTQDCLCGSSVCQASSTGLFCDTTATATKGPGQCSDSALTW